MNKTKDGFVGQLKIFTSVFFTVLINWNVMLDYIFWEKV